MNRHGTRLILAALAGVLAVADRSSGQSIDTPMTRLRPIGAPSAVDQYRRPVTTQAYRETAFQAPMTNPVRQTAMLQQFEAPDLPAGGMGMPPGIGNVPAGPGATANPITTVPNNNLPRSLPANPAINQAVPIDPSISSSSDFQAIPRPQLGGGFATIDNCNCISQASAYSAASGIGCGAPATYNAPQAYVAPPAQIAAPAVLPGGFVSPATSAAPVGALMSFGQENNPVQVGQGILGQPVAYVPGQPVRNWIRYIFP